MSNRVHVTVNGVTYDVTDWLSFHPGGSSIIQHYASRDATDVFMVMHSQCAYEKLERMAKAFPECATKNSTQETAVDKAFRNLNADLRREGLYHSSKFWYLYKCLTTLGIGIISFLLVTQLHLYFLGALVLGLMFQQCGWLAHDICHHEMFTNRRLNNFFGYFFGSVMNGFSPTWWKNKHNIHHAVTNVVGYDPDINNMPVLAFDKGDIDRAGKDVSRLVRWQSWYFHLAISFLKASWCYQSLCFVWTEKKHKNSYFRQQYQKETLGLCVHYTWYFLFMALCMPLSKAIMFFVVSELAGGYFIAIVVLLNHMHLPKIDPNTTPKFPSWIPFQLAGTVNVRRGILIDWFFGGLNYQIEHHLFPNLPRHNLAKTSERVRKICQEHGVSYCDPPVDLALNDLVSHVHYIALYAAKRAMEK